MTVAFSKWQGLGNDFIVVSTTDLDLIPTPELARKWCDRRFGIGADGVLFLSPESGFTARMMVLNADGSRPEMCGNGLRCAAAHLLMAGGVTPGSIVVQTDAGPYQCRVSTDGQNHDVMIPMGAVHFEPGLAGLRDDLWPKEVGGLVDVPLPDGQMVRGWVASTGNPHFIVETPRDPMVVAQEIGLALSTGDAFAKGVNASFVRVVDGEIEQVVYERGAGLTLACGTGAVAAAAALVAAGRLDGGQKIRTRLPGGPLWLDVSPSERREVSGAVVMTGPARLVFEGQIRQVDAT